MWIPCDSNSCNYSLEFHQDAAGDARLPSSALDAALLQGDFNLEQEWSAKPWALLPPSKQTPPSCLPPSTTRGNNSDLVDRAIVHESCLRDEGGDSSGQHCRTAPKDLDNGCIFRCSNGGDYTELNGSPLGNKEFLLPRGESPAKSHHQTLGESPPGFVPIAAVFQEPLIYNAQDSSIWNSSPVAADFLVVNCVTERNQGAQLSGRATCCPSGLLVRMDATASKLIVSREGDVPHRQSSDITSSRAVEHQARCHDRMTSSHSSVHHRERSRQGENLLNQGAYSNGFLIERCSFTVMTFTLLKENSLTVSKNVLTYCRPWLLTTCATLSYRYTLY